MFTELAEIVGVATAVVELAAWAGAITIIAAAVLVLVRGLKTTTHFFRNVSSLVNVAQDALSHFIPDDDSATLPEKVDEIGENVKRMADGMEHIVATGEELVLRVGNLESRVDTLEQARNAQIIKEAEIEIQKGGKI